MTKIPFPLKNISDKFQEFFDNDAFITDWLNPSLVIVTPSSSLWSQFKQHDGIFIYYHNALNPSFLFKITSIQVNTYTSLIENTWLTNWLEMMMWIFRTTTTTMTTQQSFVMNKRKFKFLFLMHWIKNNMNFYLRIDCRLNTL